MAQNKQAFVGLDVGNNSVVCVIGVQEPDAPAPSVIGLGSALHNGMRKGNVIDITETAEAINKAVDQAERISGYAVDGATIGINGSHILSLNSKGVIAVGGVNREITEDDVNRVGEAAAVVQLPPNREIVQIFPRNYRLDGQDNIKDPVGMSGVRLEVDAHIVTASTPALKNLDKALMQVDIKAKRHVPTPLAASEPLLTKNQREHGVCVVDIGANTTGLAVFEEGEVIHTVSIPIGSAHITNDLAVGLRVDLELAEKIKIAHVSFDQPIEKKITIEYQKENHSFDGKKVQFIALARLSEIFERINNELDVVGLRAKLPGGATITGGGANMKGIAQFASNELHLAARVGKPRGFSGIIENIKNPEYTTAIGLMLYDMESEQPNYSIGTGFSKATGLFTDFFSKFKP